MLPGTYLGQSMLIRAFFLLQRTKYHVGFPEEVSRRTSTEKRGRSSGC